MGFLGEEARLHLTAKAERMMIKSAQENNGSIHRKSKEKRDDNLEKKVSRIAQPILPSFDGPDHLWRFFETFYNE